MPAISKTDGVGNEEVCHWRGFGYVRSQRVRTGIGSGSCRRERTGQGRGKRTGGRKPGFDGREGPGEGNPCQAQQACKARQEAHEEAPREARNAGRRFGSGRSVELRLTPRSAKKPVIATGFFVSFSKFPELVATQVIIIQ